MKIVQLSKKKIRERFQLPSTEKRLNFEFESSQVNWELKQCPPPKKKKRRLFGDI